MSDHMGVRIELWAAAADKTGIWLVNGGGEAWLSDRLDADSQVHAEVLDLAGQHVPAALLPVIHSPSWRQEGPGVILTYIAVASAPEHVQDFWPGALPVTPELLGATGRPWPHAAEAPPVNRYVDVLLHAVRHLAFLDGTDAGVRKALTRDWKNHLAEWEPALSGLYLGEIQQVA